MAIRFTIFPPDDAARPSVIAFDMEKILVGRGAICDLRLPHPRVSYHHATVEVDGRLTFIRDTGSTNGTTVNAERIPPDFRQVIRSEDIIEIGGFRIVPTLSVAMQGAHSDERTEAVARSLLRTTAPRREEARLEVVEGPDRGAVLVLPDDGAETMRIGRGEQCELRLTDPQVERLHAEVRRGIAGWSLKPSGGDVDAAGSRRSSIRLSHGQVIELGATQLVFTDPLDAYYRALLRTREDIEASGDEPDDAAGDDEEDTLRDEAPPEPVIEVDPAGFPPEEDTITSRTEVVDSGSDGSRMPEYSWMVVLLGVLAFIASLGLLLLLIF